MEYPNGMTVKELKDLIKDWPEETDRGDPTEVWMESGQGLSSPVFEVSKLNVRENDKTGETYSDIIFHLGGS